MTERKTPVIDRQVQVLIEGKAPVVAKSIDDALAVAGRSIYLTPQRAMDARHALRQGKAFSYAYGFSGVHFTPKEATT